MMQPYLPLITTWYMASAASLFSLFFHRLFGSSSIDFSALRQPCIPSPAETFRQTTVSVIFCLATAPLNLPALGRPRSFSRPIRSCHFAGHLLLPLRSCHFAGHLLLPHRHPCARRHAGSRFLALLEICSHYGRPLHFDRVLQICDTLSDLVALLVLLQTRQLC